MNIRKLHPWNVDTESAKKIQQSLREDFLVLENECNNINIIAGADVSYSKNSDLLFAAVVLLKYSTLEIIEKVSSVDKVSFPYIPGYLSFREVPVLVKSFEKLNIEPDVVICDGQGIAHPRRLGLASHLGIVLNVPTIGVAKKRLVGEYSMPDEEAGSYSELIYKNKKIGIVFRSRKYVKPIFISPGHKVDFDTSIKIVKNVVKKFRIPLPIRKAHKYVNEMRKMYQ